MKSAFVLGLALAANAQMDNEFISLPYNPTGADLVRHHADIRPTTFSRPSAYVVRKDDVADDELLSLSGADLVKYAKQSQSTVYRPVAHVVRDDEADDELFGSGRFVPDTTTKKSENKTSYVPDPNIRHHSDLPHTGSRIDFKTLGKYDKVTNHLDDELFGSGRFVPDTTIKKSENKTSYVPDPNIRRHSDLPHTGSRIDFKTIGKYDKVTNHLDDELFGSGRFVPDTTTKSEKKTSSEPYIPDPNIRHHSDLPHTGSRIDFKTIGKYDKVTNHLDDELAYLGHLIKEIKPEIRRKFRPVEMN